MGKLMQDEILATFEDYARTYCVKDIDGLMAVFDDQDGITAIGTGADELCANRADIRQLFERNFAEASAKQFEWHWRQVTMMGDDAAVVAATLTIHLDLDGEALSVPIRWSVSLLRRAGGWKWTHRHASSAAGGQQDGAAYPR